MIIIPIQESNLFVKFAGIFGLQPWAFLIIFLVLCFGGLYIYSLLNDKLKHDRYLKMVTMPDGKTMRINGIFIQSTRRAYEKLCDVDMHEVNIKGDKKIKDVSGLMFAPKVTTQRIPQYYVDSKCVQDIRWPKTAKATQQVSIGEIIYRENIPYPAFSYEEMTKEERVEQTAILSGISADQNVANAVVTEIQQKFDAFTKAVRELKNIKLILLLVFVNIIVGAVGALLAFQSYNVVNALRGFLGVK
jgi:predicted small secreted protein